MKSSSFKTRPPTLELPVEDLDEVWSTRARRWVRSERRYVPPPSSHAPLRPVAPSSRRASTLRLVEPDVGPIVPVPPASPSSALTLLQRRPDDVKGPDRSGAYVIEQRSNRAPIALAVPVAPPRIVPLRAWERPRRWAEGIVSTVSGRLALTIALVGFAVLAAIATLAPASDQPSFVADERADRTVLPVTVARSTPSPDRPALPAAKAPAAPRPVARPAATHAVRPAAPAPAPPPAPAAPPQKKAPSLQRLEDAQLRAATR